MQIKEWGEDNFIHYLTKTFSTDADVLGIGDDCAVVPVTPEKSWLITTDALVEGIHFLKDQISAKDLGYKAIAVNVSDVAAMGGLPQYAFLTIALPKGTKQGWICNLIEGISEACKQWNVQLLGGDTVGSKRDIFLNLTLIGSAAPASIKYRNTAQEGDIICVNGCLGNSAAGLKALQEQLPMSYDVKELLLTHFRPKVEMEQAMWLASQEGIHAMMDLSDGLDCDLRRLIKSSQKGACIETSHLPLSKALLNVSNAQQWDPLKLAISGGEDYMLLFTVSSEAFDELQQKFENKFNSILHAIGHIIGSSRDLHYETKGRRIEVEQAYFDHFQ